MSLPNGGPEPDDSFRWDVFLSYHTVDKSSVGVVATVLRDMGLKVWWDEWEIEPSAFFIDRIWEGLKESRAAIVFIGPTKLGEWQSLEIKAAIAAKVEKGRRVLPVFLPGVPNPDTVDLGFLSLASRAVFGSDLHDTAVLNRIYWGITGINPEKMAAPPKPAATVPHASASDDAVPGLASWLKAGNVTFFVGPATSAITPSLPPRDWEIASELLREISLVDPNVTGMLPPVDVAATLYAVSKSDPVLEQTVVGLVQSRSTSIPSAHCRLAELLKKLGHRDKPRGRRMEKQLILTTNIDLMIERALLRAEIGFTRVVQHKSEAAVYVADFHHVAFVPQSDEQLDELIATTTQLDMKPEMVAGPALVEPILYKMRGSLDISGSCSLTRPQLLTQARAMIAEHLIPAELQKIASNTPIVFLGVGLLDPAFQYISHTVLFNAWESDHEKYLVQVAPDQDVDDGYRRVETALWEKLKQSATRRKLTTIEERSDRFLERLAASV